MTDVVRTGRVAPPPIRIDPVDDGVHDDCVSQDQLARVLHTQDSLEATLDAVLRQAVELSAGVDAAGVNLYVRKRFEPQAVRGVAPPLLDELQKRLGTGPCIEASRQQTTVLIEDMRTDARWPEFAQRALELGVAAMVCLPLWVDDGRLGSLSLYASRRDVLDDQVVHLGSILATHAALAIVHARRSDNLLVAVESRDVIGQAKGILMERYRITADEAFELILSSSHAVHRKVHLVAEELTATGELPTPPA